VRIVLVRIALDFIELAHMCMPNGLGAAVCGISGHLTRYVNPSLHTLHIHVLLIDRDSSPSKVNRLSVLARVPNFLYGVNRVELLTAQ
jgi:hypothetical protein